MEVVARLGPAGGRLHIGDSGIYQGRGPGARQTAPTWKDPNTIDFMAMVASIVDVLLLLFIVMTSCSFSYCWPLLLDP